MLTKSNVGPISEAFAEYLRAATRSGSQYNSFTSSSSSDTGSGACTNRSMFLSSLGVKIWTSLSPTKNDDTSLGVPTVALRPTLWKSPASKTNLSRAMLS